MSYIGQQLPADVFSGFVTDSFTGDGSATTFTLSKAPFSEDALIVVINNVIQKPVTNFTVSGTTLTIVGDAVASGDPIYAMHTSGAVPSTLASKVDVNGLSDGVVLDADADTTISADTDDQIDFKAGGTDVMSMTATGLTINDGVEITTADTTDTLTLTSTDQHGNSGPNLRLYRNSVSPAVGDNLGQIDFEGRNDNSEDVVYASMMARARDETDGTEDGGFQIDIMQSGTLRSLMKYYSNGGTEHELSFNDDSKDIDFRVESDTQTHAIYLVGSSSRLGVNNSGPGRTLHIINPVEDVYGLGVDMTVASGNPYGSNIRFTDQSPDNRTSTFLVTNDGTTSRCIIYSDGDIENHDNSYGAFSDERIKQDIRDSNSQWDDIKALKIRNYKKKDDVRQYGDKAWEQIGVIAQEIEAAGMDKLIRHADPSAADIISSSEFGTLYEDGDDIPEGKKIGDVKEVKEQVKAVKYSILYMKAIKALQEAMAKIETLETKVKALEDA